MTLGSRECPNCGKPLPEAVAATILADGLALLAASVLVKGESRLAKDLATMAEASRGVLERRQP